ncbi:hypothetical protein NQ317_001735 [Molorchus minor]|uniref:Dilute domain-containing protein n=1 Tax=Molorchus minor TaxID=1323400 RepID=A0ABQ9JUR1_9CUCU|nr:hypothetical protein NQ317_001735 [Molorchus minor]
MPPFQLEITSKLYQMCIENYQAKAEYQLNEEADILLKKLQALLCNILTYVASSMTLDHLLQVFPQRFSTVNENLNRDNYNDNISSLKDDYGKNKFNYTDNDLDILKEIQNYEPYIVICKETMHANQINKLITTTGQQLLCTLNL